MLHKAGYIEQSFAFFAVALLLALHPDLINMIAARARLTVDLRNTDERRLQQAEQELADFVATLARREGVTVEIRRLARFEPVRFDAGLARVIASAARGAGAPHGFGRRA